jgi:hypothetical protein
MGLTNDVIAKMDKYFELASSCYENGCEVRERTLIELG